MRTRKPKPPKPRHKITKADQARIDAQVELLRAVLARCDAEIMKNLKRSYWEI